MEKGPKILIIGYGRHGKDEMAMTLEDHFGVKLESSSEAAVRIFLYDKLKDEFGYSSFKECHKDRINHRKRWYDEITEYNREDRTRLTKNILKDNDGYIGLRNPEELEQAKREGLFDITVWVDASDRVPPESESSCGVSKEDADVIIDNNGTLEQFRERVIRFGSCIFSNQTFKVKPIPRIVWDVDGVVADFNRGFLDHMYSLGVIDDKDTPAVDWYDPRFRENFHMVADDTKFWESLPPVFDGRIIDYPIAGYVTARPVSSDLTKSWLQKNNFPSAPVITVGVDGSKVDSLKELEADVFVDDRFENFMEVERSGCVSVNLLADRSHNQKYDISSSKRLYHMSELKYRLGLHKN